MVTSASRRARYEMARLDLSLPPEGVADDYPKTFSFHVTPHFRAEMRLLCVNSGQPPRDFSFRIVTIAAWRWLIREQYALTKVPDATTCLARQLYSEILALRRDEDEEFGRNRASAAKTKTIPIANIPPGFRGHVAKYLAEHDGIKFAPASIAMWRLLAREQGNHRPGEEADRSLFTALKSEIERLKDETATTSSPPRYVGGPFDGGRVVGADGAEIVVLSPLGRGRYVRQRAEGDLVYAWEAIAE